MKRILFAEDKLSYKKGIEDALRAAGYEVTAVENGADAIEALQHASFDLVLTDYCMPFRNGGEVAREARAKSIPHIIINTSMEPGTVKEIPGVTIVQKMDVGTVAEKVNALLKKS